MSKEEGKLSDITLPEIIRDIYINRRTGILHLRKDDVEKCLLFSRGNLLSARSNLPEERIGEILVQRGKLSPDVRDSALNERSPGRRFGTVLVELGALKPHDLLESLKEQAILIISPVLSWASGDFRFEHSEELESKAEQHLPTANIIMEAVRRIEDSEVIIRGLKDYSSTIVLSSNPLLRFQSISLRPKEGFILSRIDGFLSIQEVCAISPVPEEDTLRCIYGLLSAGILELQPSQVRAASGRSSAKLDGNLASFFFDLAGTEDYLEEEAQSADPKAALSEEERKQEEEIEDYARQLTAMTHYEILDLDRQADAPAVKKAYYRLAKKYHPDRYRSGAQQRMQATLEKIFIKVNEAYETLSNEDERRNYDQRLPVEASETVQEDTAEELRQRQETLAEQNFRQAKQLYDQGDFYGAIQLFKRAWHHNPKRAAYAHHLAVALTKNPKWQKQAEEFFLKAIEIDPYNAEHYAQLGKLYQKAALTTRADKRFREALKWDAGNRTALDGLTQLEAEKNQGISQSIKSLFGEKKKK